MTQVSLIRLKDIRQDKPSHRDTNTVLQQTHHSRSTRQHEDLRRRLPPRALRPARPGPGARSLADRVHRLRAPRRPLVSLAQPHNQSSTPFKKQHTHPTPFTNRHCEGPRPPATTSEPTTSTPPAVITTTTSAAGDDDHDDHEHTDEAGTATLAPSPTESIGCEPHGDHWHCEGPRPPATETETGSDGAETSAPVVDSPSSSSLVTVATTATTEAGGEAASTTSSAVSTAGAAGGPAFAAVPVLGLAAFAALGM